MWFKNLYVLRMTGVEAAETAEEGLQAGLNEHRFEPCSPHCSVSLGWVSPFDDEGDYLAPGSMGANLLCMKVETREVPKTMIKEEARIAFEKLKKDDSELKLSRSLRRELEDDARAKLMKRALSSYKRIFGCWDNQNKTLIVDTTSQKTAFAFADLFRDSLGGSGAYYPLQTNYLPSRVMGGWLINDEVPVKLEAGQAATLKDHDGGTIRYRRQDLEDARLHSYLSESKVISDLELSYSHGGLTFVLSDGLLIKSIKWGNELLAEADDANPDSKAAAMMASFTIMHKNATELIGYLIDECFGGEAGVEAQG